MKKSKFLSLFIVMIMLVVAVVPAYAGDLGDNDSSEFVVQNTSGAQVTVTIQFVNSTGAIITPTCLDTSNPCTFPNNFDLAAAASKVVKVSNVPAAQLPPGNYSVIISSTGQVVALATVSGTGTRQFTGGYTSFGSGAPTVYLSTVAFNFTSPAWYSMITVQNLGDVATNVTVTITCTNAGYVGVTGTLTRNNLPAKASYTWALKVTTPTGFDTVNTHCQGGAVVNSSNGQNLVVVNNQNQPTEGRTNTFESVTSGSTKIYVPQLSASYFDWVSALNILKQGSGSTTVTIDWGDGETDDTCSLTNTTPSCQLFIPSVHSTGKRFSAVITSSPPMTLLVSAGSSHILGFSAGYNGLSEGYHAVALPLVMRNYFGGWITAINCMNVSPTPTQITVDYEGVAPYDHPTTLNEGQSIQIVSISDTHLVDGYLGSAIITAKASGALIACMVGNSGAQTIPGDYTEQYISLQKP